VDVVVLGALLVIKAQSDMTVIYSAAAGIAVVFFGENCSCDEFHKLVPVYRDLGVPLG